MNKLNIFFLNFTSKFFNIIFNPLVLPLYVLMFVLFVDNNYFIGFNNDQKIKLFVIAIINLLFFPTITILLLRGLGFIKNFLFIEKKDRIIAFCSLSIFYFWTFYIYKNHLFIPIIILRLFLGFFILISLMPIFEYYNKINIKLSVIFSIIYVLVFEKLFTNNENYFSFPLLIYALIINALIFLIDKIEYNQKEVLRTNSLSLISIYISSIIIKLF